MASIDRAIPSGLCRDSLPPSPPNTDSSKHTPESAKSVGAESLSPPGTTIHTPNESKSGSPLASPGMSPLAPLPNEIFLLLMQYLSQHDRARLCLVSRAWASFLHNEPRLWSTLHVRLDIDDFESLETWVRRASISSTKPGGGIVQLSVLLPGENSPLGCLPFDPHTPDTEYGERLKRVFDLVGSACLTESTSSSGTRRIRSTLRSFKVVSYPSTIATAHVAHAIAQAAHEPWFWDVEDIEIFLGMPAFPLDLQVLWSWTRTRNLALHCPRETNSVPALSLNRWRLRPSRGALPQVECALEQLSMRGAAIIHSIAAPITPALTSIVLRDVDWHGMSIFSLLRAARRTLVYLELRDVSVVESSEVLDVEDHQRWIDPEDRELMAEFEMIKAQGFFPNLETVRSETAVVLANEAADDDIIPADPLPILLPALQTLVLTGEITPPLFASMDQLDTGSDEPWLPTPLLLMPSVATVQLLGLTLDVHDEFADDGRSVLTVLGVCAPNITSLTIADCEMDEASLGHCLMLLNTSMRSLALYNTTVTDQLVANLARLVPMLEELDVRRCSEVSAQGVARLAEVIREQSGGEHKLSSVRIDHPNSRDAADFAAYEWLDFVGTLKRDAWDFESLGPPRGTPEWHQWKCNGKLDVQWQWRERVRREEERQRYERQQLAAQARLVQNGLAGYGQPLHAGSTSGGLSKNANAASASWYRVPEPGSQHTPGAGQSRGPSLSEIAALHQQQSHVATNRVGINVQGVPFGAVHYPTGGVAPPSPITPSTRLLELAADHAVAAAAAQAGTMTIDQRTMDAVASRMYTTGANLAPTENDFSSADSAEEDFDELNDD